MRRIARREDLKCVGIATRRVHGCVRADAVGPTAPVGVLVEPRAVSAVVDDFGRSARRKDMSPAATDEFVGGARALDFQNASRRGRDGGGQQGGRRADGDDARGHGNLET